MRTYKIRVPNHKHFCGRDIMGNFSNEPNHTILTIKADGYDKEYGVLDLVVHERNGGIDLPMAIRAFAPGQWREIEEVENG